MIMYLLTVVRSVIKMSTSFLQTSVTYIPIIFVLYVTGLIIWKWIVYPKYRSPLRHLPQAPVPPTSDSIISPHSLVYRTVPFSWDSSRRLFVPAQVHHFVDG